MNILLAFRNLFAADRVFLSIGAAVRQGVEDIIIPQLKRRQSPAPEQLSAQYTEFLSSKWLDTFAEKSVSSAAWRYHQSNSPLIFDVAERLAGDFIINKRMHDVFFQFNPLDGVEKFKRFIVTVVYNHSLSLFREHTTRTRKEEPSGFAKMDRPEIPQQDVEELISDMKEYFYSHVSGVNKAEYQIKSALEIFGLYVRQIDQKGLDYGPDNVRSLWESMRKKKDEVFGRDTFYSGLKIVKDVLKQFFIEQKRYQRAAGKTIAERVAKSEFRRRLAKFILGK